MRLEVKKLGDWNKFANKLYSISRNLIPRFKVQMNEDGEFIRKTIVDHIDNQDMGWVPLKAETVELKGGSEKILVETGKLRDSFEVSKIHFKDYAIVVGVDGRKKSRGGASLTDLIIWLEYGTDKMPARPLIRPTWEDIEPILKKRWGTLFNDIVSRS